MAKRRSVQTGDFKHRNPIPPASRIGNLVMSGRISGRDSATDVVPDTMEEQCRAMFANMRVVVEAAGGTTDDIIKLTVWLKDLNDRRALNAEWEKMFPDPESRPARQAILLAGAEGKVLIACDFVAVINE